MLIISRLGESWPQHWEWLLWDIILVPLFIDCLFYPKYFIYNAALYCLKLCACPYIHQITSHPGATLCSSPFPPSTFCLCSEGRSAVIQGCHMQKKLPSNNIEGCEATVYSPPPHLMCPLPPSLSLCSSVVEMEWHGRQLSLLLSDEFRQQIQNREEERRWRESGRKGGGG